jgi:hypothetical protein
VNEKDYSEFLHSAVFREYEKRIDDHFRSTDARATFDRQAWEQEFKSIAQNLKLQAAEYERRLTDLNHAHANAVKAQELTVPREIFTSFLRDYENWKDQLRKWQDGINADGLKVASLLERTSNVERKIEKISTDQASINARVLTWGSVAAIALAALQITLTWVRR